MKKITGSNFDDNEDKLKKISEFSDLQRTDKVSFYIRQKIDLPKDLCDKGFTIKDLPNLDIINKSGRDRGEKVLYDPVDKKNYLSLFERYEKSIKRYPDKIKVDNGKITYYFCSSQSPSGFWEVTLESNGTFIKFEPPTLTIICPRPFRLQDLINVSTDGESFIWEQNQGRAIIISPLSGEGSTNPFLSIIGVRDADDPPILINATLADNPTVFAYIAIQTTIREFIDGINITSSLQKDSGELLEVPCIFTPVVISSNIAFVWSSGTIGITFNKPNLLSNWIKEYWLQENINGFYQTISVNTIQYFNIEASKRYRIISIFKTLANDFFGTKSCSFQFDYFPRKVLTADKINGLNISSLDNQTSQYPLSVINCDIDSELFRGVSLGIMKNESYIYNLIGSIVG